MTKLHINTPLYAFHGLLIVGLFMSSNAAQSTATASNDDISTMLQRLIPTSASIRATGNSREQPLDSADEDLQSYSSDDGEDASANFDYSNMQPSPSTLLIQNESDEEPDGLNLTKMHEEAIQHRKAQIKDALLSKLRLTKLPSPNLAILYQRFPHHLLGNAAMQMDSIAPKDNYHAKVENLLRFPQSVPSMKAAAIRNSDLVQKTIFIPLPVTVDRDNLKKATLLVYIKTPAGAEGQQTVLDLRTNRMTKKNLLYSEKVILEPRGDWHHIDITDECKTWLRNEWSNNIGLVATATYKGFDLIEYDSRQAVNNDTFDRIPFIKLELNDYDPDITRRSFDSLPISCEPEDHEKRCCRYKFVLDFGELGREFDFIISPKRYYANYCAGNCPSYQLPNVPLTLGIRRNVQRCCTPSQLDSLRLIYQDDSRDVIESQLPGMSISTCGCD